MAAKRMSRQESDLVSLRTEREANKFPLSKAPFLRADTLTAAEQEVSPIYFALSQSDCVPSSR